MRRSVEEWVEHGKLAILELLEFQHAAPWPEVEARISEIGWGAFDRVDPNHLITARESLKFAGRIEMSRHATRGGRVLDVYSLPVVSGDNATRVARASARKRLLHARWLGWAMGDKRYPQGFMGAAGERVVRQSLMAAPRDLYAPVSGDYHSVSNLLGAPVPGGTLDSAAWCLSRDGGAPGLPVLLPIEVKNLREWLFPHSHQVYQVLRKGAGLARLHPAVPIVPTLICRRKSIMTMWMAQDLGFFVIELKRQFMQPSKEYTAEEIAEVKDELGFEFLSVGDGPDLLLGRILIGTLPSRATEFASRWRERGAQFEAEYRVLMDDELDVKERDDALARLRDKAARLPDASGGW
jgi:hypothetical protein